MGSHIFKGLFCLHLCLCCSTSPAVSLKNPPLDGICFRFYDQWKVGDQDRTRLHQKYGVLCVHFDEKGKVLTDGVAPSLEARFTRFYNQCMRDGCLFCDADEGSCELGTCGLKNADCKPYMREGRPLCGEDCAYYALNQL